MKKFHIEMGEPYVVAQGTPEDRMWGQIQFPRIIKTEDGGVCVNWNYGNDEIDYNYVIQSAFSSDGKTWRAKRKEDFISYPKMKNGNYFAGFKKQSARKADYIIFSDNG